ncbi:hypothetical protein, partial [Streptoalloteichus tenebrarius]|uniref:hypothetical protein n=1 Tax=Streptoalloteichus tenebrarius (strain ATCC 17920 / DSM 40477 / JCM 4838 / CBS 697.72 / NBRC 16177 / NCIMB 11028 / NRRL B-12390 / A12253. 1 / ISP 5477) TaxID=1933 RepID=UPI0035E5719E
MARVIAGVISERDWEVWVGSGSVRAHRHTTGANRLVMPSVAPFSLPSRPGFEGRPDGLSLKVGVADLDPRGAARGHELTGGQGQAIELLLRGIGVIKGMLFSAGTLHRCGGAGAGDRRGDQWTSTGRSGSAPAACVPTGTPQAA